MNVATAVTPDGQMVAGGDNWFKTTGQTGTFGPFPGFQDQTEAYGLAGTAQAPVAVGGTRDSQNMLAGARAAPMVIGTRAPNGATSRVQMPAMAMKPPMNGR